MCCLSVTLKGHRMLTLEAEMLQLVEVQAKAPTGPVWHQDIPGFHLHLFPIERAIPFEMFQQRRIGYRPHDL